MKQKSVDYKARWRIKHPMKAAYQTLKYNAKRRGKEFTITYEEFKLFAFKTHLLTRRGVKSTSYSVDRIDNNKGYIEGNIQCLPLGKNVQKQRYLEIEGRGIVIVKANEIELQDSPF